MRVPSCSVYLNSHHETSLARNYPLFKATPLPSYRNMSTLPRALSVAMFGGGPGGLSLARILQRNDINPTVFEREASVNERSQGGTLDLHYGKALKDAGLMGEFMAHARFEGDAAKIQDKTGKVYFEHSSDNVKSENDPHARPEIDRYVHNIHAADHHSNHKSI